MTDVAIVYEMIETAIIYHQVKPGIDCADGIAAAWVTKRKYKHATLIGASYEGEIPDVSAFDQLFIVDFSFALSVLREWQAQGKTVVVIDHHKTAMADLSKFDSAVFRLNESGMIYDFNHSGAIFDLTECGATLAWKSFFPDEPMPPILGYVRDRDLWDFKLPMSEEIHEAVSFMGRTLEQFDYLSTLSQENLIEALAPLGARLLQPKRVDITKLAKNMHECIIMEHVGMAVSIPESKGRLVSDTCSFLLRKYNDYEFVVAYTWSQRQAKWMLAFRSDKHGRNFDVSILAKKFNGGGNQNAAGGISDSIDFLRQEGYPYEIPEA